MGVGQEKIFAATSYISTRQFFSILNPPDMDCLERAGRLERADLLDRADFPGRVDLLEMPELPGRIGLSGET